MFALLLFTTEYAEDRHGPTYIAWPSPLQLLCVPFCVDQLRMSEAVMGIWLSLVRLAGTGGGEESLSDGEHVQPASPPRAPAAKEMEGEPILLLCPWYKHLLHPLGRTLS